MLGWNNFSPSRRRQSANNSSRLFTVRTFLFGGFESLLSDEKKTKKMFCRSTSSGSSFTLFTLFPIPTQSHPREWRAPKSTTRSFVCTTSPLFNSGVMTLCPGEFKAEREMNSISESTQKSPRKIPQTKGVEPEENTKHSDLWLVY